MLNTGNGVEGFGVGSGEELDALNKALSTGYDETTSMTGGAALRVQSLEQTLKILTFSSEHCVLFKKINKLPAYSTVEEYTQLTSYGSTGGSFVPEGVLPEGDDSSYQRRAALVKYLGTTRTVTHPMTLVKTMAGVQAVARETENGTLKIMRDIEDALFWGNAGLAYNYPTVEGIEWNGLNSLIDSANDIDLANQNLEEGNISDLTEIIFSNYGNCTDLFLSTNTLKILSKSMLPKERIAVPAGAAVSVGVGIGEVKTQYGTVAMNPNVFLATGRSPKKTVPGSGATGAPTAPASIAAGALTGSDGKFRSAQIGAIKFRATACNRYGESAPCSLSSAANVTSADLAKHIPLTITNAASVVTAPEWFNIYATEVGGSTTYLIAQVAASSQADNGTTTYNYTGYIIPNTSIAFGLDMSPNVMTLKQLAPLMKMDLATIAPSYRFMVLFYAVPQLFAPKKCARIVNIKDY